tara:strand:+ start:85 stop:195 length:111 start_codon:yes stop_codon:yes gene_type:complete
MKKEPTRQNMLNDMISIKKDVGNKEDLKPSQHNKLS